jgi:hypothetical protein
VPFGVKNKTIGGELPHRTVASPQGEVMEKKYGVEWYETHGECTFSHPVVVSKIAEAITAGSTAPLWLKNHRGQVVLADENTDSVFASVQVVTADTCALTAEEAAELSFPVLRIAMPKGRFKLDYPKSMQEDFPWEHRQWDEGFSDCYRIALDYYDKALGLPLRSVTTPKNYTAQMMTYSKVNLFVENFAACGFEQVLIAEPGDALLFQSGLATFDGPDHVGVYLEGGKFLHHYRNRLSVIQPYSSMWRQKTSMVLRHTSRM